ncbi:MAG: hypothetical protein AAFX81_18565 [Pseudomonadota bacterium]
MKGIRRAAWLRFVLAVILTLGTTAAAGHRAGAAVPGLVDLQGYALPDGSLPWLCVFGGGDASGDPLPTACEFAGLAGMAVQLGVPPRVSAPEHLLHHRPMAPPRASRATLAPTVALPPSRAPPAACG